VAGAAIRALRVMMPRSIRVDARSAEITLPHAAAHQRRPAVAFTGGLRTCRRA